MILATVPSHRRLWARALLAAAGVHALAIGAMLFRLSASAEPTTELPAIAVEMAPPMSVPAPVHDIPTPDQVEAPQPDPQKRQSQKKLPFDPPPPTAPEVRPDVALPPKETSPPAPETPKPMPPAPATTEQAAPDLKPDLRVAALMTGGATAGKATASDLWSARVRSRIELMKRYPGAAAQQHQEDDVDVLLTIDRSGRLLESSIRSDRGYMLLNDAALDAVRRAAPFPKPPKEVEGDPIRYSVIIRFHARSPVM